MNTPIGEVVASIDLGPDVLARSWARSDAAVLVAAWGTEDIARWNPVPPEPTPAVAEQWIAGVEAQTTDSPAADVVLERNGEIVGEVGLRIDRSRRLAEIGFWVGADHRRAGVGAALLELAEQLAPHLGVEHLVAVTDTANDAAIGLLHRCGWAEVRTTTTERRAFARSVGGS